MRDVVSLVIVSTFLVISVFRWHLFYLDTFRSSYVIVYTYSIRYCILVIWFLFVVTFVVVCAFTYNQTWELFSRVYYYRSGILHFHICLWSGCLTTSLYNSLDLYVTIAFQTTPPQIQIF